MTCRDPVVSLRQMRDHAREAMELVGGRNRQDLEEGRMLNLAVVRLLEIVGEAANRVPNEVQSKHPGIPWREIIGMRNRLIHGYDQVDFEVLWQILTRDLPGVVQNLDRALPPENVP
jgi:uncharacterized protein with HEPN domain